METIEKMSAILKKYGCDKLFSASNSREHQDLVVIALFGGKQQGTYLEIGGGPPIVDNNTYLLEKELGWRGVSIELDSNLINQWQKYRKNPCIQKDATTLDYHRVLTSYDLGPNIDFLQVDIDGTNKAQNNGSFKVLQRIDFKKYSFGFITFEHNLYLDKNNAEHLLSRELLFDHGYTMLISDVSHKDMIYEDWYVLERLMPNNDWYDLRGDRTPMHNSNGSWLHHARQRGNVQGYDS